eukprot:scaffold27202_cov64-Phaeocystis_antarctica.AAC.2
MEIGLPHSTPPSLPGTFSRQHSSATARPAASPSMRASGASCSLGRCQSGARKAASLHKLPALDRAHFGAHARGKWSEQCADRKREFECGGFLALIARDARAATRTPQERVFQDTFLECAWLYVRRAISDERGM